VTHAAHTDRWAGEGVTVTQIDHELACLRDTTADGAHGAYLRTSVMTHMAWVPEDWLEVAIETLAGLAERHPSRTIIVVPDGDAPDRLDAELSLECFPLPGEERHICSEVIQLRLGGRRAQAAASIVQPLLIADLPVFLRWRGQPPFGAPEFEQLIDVTDRLVVDSREWPELPEAYEQFADAFERAAASDIAWARTIEWRCELAKHWPGIETMRGLKVAGPLADGLLLAGWLRSRLGVDIDLDHDDAEWVEAVAIDGHPIEAPAVPRPSASDLLSDELDKFGRDPIFEAAVRAAAAR
jgi:hypothetical protein